MLDILWGAKTAALFDIWFLEHFISGVSMGKIVNDHNRNILSLRGFLHKHSIHPRFFDIVGVLCIAYAWETVEHYLEIGLLGDGVAYWFQGVEFWGNRIITDPLMMVLGYLFVQKFPHMVVYARIFTVVWLVFHIFVFPHSMYLHEVVPFL